MNDCQEFINKFFNGDEKSAVDFVRDLIQGERGDSFLYMGFEVVLIGIAYHASEPPREEDIETYIRRELDGLDTQVVDELVRMSDKLNSEVINSFLVSSASFDDPIKLLDIMVSNADQAIEDESSMKHVLSLNSSVGVDVLAVFIAVGVRKGYTYAVDEDTFRSTVMEATRRLADRIEAIISAVKLMKSGRLSKYIDIILATSSACEVSFLHQYINRGTFLADIDDIVCDIRDPDVVDLIDTEWMMKVVSHIIVVETLESIMRARAEISKIEIDESVINETPSSSRSVPKFVTKPPNVTPPTGVSFGNN